GSALNLDGGDGLPLFEPFGDFPRGLGAPLCHGNVRLVSVVVVSAHWGVQTPTSLIRQTLPVANPASRTQEAYHCPSPSARLHLSLLRRSLRQRPGVSARSSRRSVPRPFPGR